jgi:hypothetical protein
MKPDPSHFSADSRAKQHGWGDTVCGGATALEGSLSLGNTAASSEPHDGEGIGPRLRFINSLLQLLRSGLPEDPSWTIPPDDIAEACQQVGIYPVPLTTRGAELALIRLAPELLRLARAPNPSKLQAWDEWKAAVERSDYMGAKANLQLLGLLPLK